MKFVAAALLMLVSSVCFAQEDPGFGPPSAVQTKGLVLVHVGGLYFHGMAESVDAEGEYRNHPAAVIRLHNIRITENRTFILGTAQSDTTFFLTGPASLNANNLRVKVISKKPTVIEVKKGEFFMITMEGEHELFKTVGRLPRYEDDVQEENNDGGNAPLFNPVPQSELPPAVQPRSIRVPDPRDPAAIELEGTIEPLEPKPEKAPIRMDGPVAGEHKKKS